MLRSRILTASILLIGFVAMVFFLHPYIFAVSVALFFVLGAYEWAALCSCFSNVVFGEIPAASSLCSTKSVPIYRFLFVVMTILGLYLVYFLALLPVLILSLSIWLWATLAIITYQTKGTSLGFQFPFTKALSGWLILISCWKSIIFLQANAPAWLMIIFCLCWLMDTGAFFSGKKWGKHYLAPRISPKKTWEGFWGGIILSVCLVTMASWFQSLSLKQHLLMIALILVCAIYAVVGDLFVSLLKRQIGVKDTGVILPGHGGLLDRVDSTLSTLPIFSLGYLLIIHSSF